MGCQREQPAGKKFERAPEKQTLRVDVATGGKRISPNRPYIPLSRDIRESPVLELTFSKFLKAAPLPSPGGGDAGNTSPAPRHSPLGNSSKVLLGGKKCEGEPPVCQGLNERFATLTDFISKWIWLSVGMKLEIPKGTVGPMKDWKLP
jgi:hypothetical protein